MQRGGKEEIPNRDFKKMFGVFMSPLRFSYFFYSLTFSVFGSFFVQFHLKQDKGGSQTRKLTACGKKALLNPLCGIVVLLVCGCTCHLPSLQCTVLTLLTVHVTILCSCPWLCFSVLAPTQHVPHRQTLKPSVCLHGGRKPTAPSSRYPIESTITQDDTMRMQLRLCFSSFRSCTFHFV